MLRLGPCSPRSRLPAVVEGHAGQFGQPFLRPAAIGAEAAEEDQITVDHLVELQLAKGISLAEVAMLEARMQGIGATVSR